MALGVAFPSEISDMATPDKVPSADGIHFARTTDPGMGLRLSCLCVSRVMLVE